MRTQVDMRSVLRAQGSGGLAKQRIVELRRRCPEIKVTQIARMVGVSRQWVSKVLKSEGLSTRPRRQEPQRCARCGKPLSCKGSTGLCQACYTSTRRNPMVKLVCAVCGKEFYRSSHLLRAVKTGGYYCSRACWGKFVGRNFGFGARPRRSRYSVEQIVELRSRGWTLREIAAEVGSSIRRVWAVLKELGLTGTKTAQVRASRKDKEGETPTLLRGAIALRSSPSLRRG